MASNNITTPLWHHVINKLLMCDGVKLKCVKFVGFHVRLGFKSIFFKCHFRGGYGLTMYSFSTFMNWISSSSLSTKLFLDAIFCILLHSFFSPFPFLTFVKLYRLALPSFLEPYFKSQQIVLWQCLGLEEKLYIWSKCVFVFFWQQNKW